MMPVHIKMMEKDSIQENQILSMLHMTKPVNVNNKYIIRGIKDTIYGYSVVPDTVPAVRKIINNGSTGLVTFYLPSSDTKYFKVTEEQIPRPSDDLKSLKQIIRTMESILANMANILRRISVEIDKDGNTFKQVSWIIDYGDTRYMFLCDIEKKSDDISMNITIYEFMRSKNMGRIYWDVIMRPIGNDVVVPVIKNGTALFVGLSDKEIVEDMTEYFSNFPIVDKRLIDAMYIGFKTIRNLTPEREEYRKLIYYNDFELELIRRVHQYHKISFCVCLIRHKQMEVNNRVSEDDLVEDFDNDFNDGGENHTIDIDKYPVISFTKREYQYVEKYADEQYLLDDNIPTNLCRYLTDPKYGYIFTEFLPNNRKLLIYVKMSESDPSFMGFHVAIYDDKSHLYKSSIIMRNINDYMGEKDNVVFLSGVMQSTDDGCKLEDSFDSILEEVHDRNVFDYDYMVNVLFKRYIGIMMVMKDNPQKVGVVTETKKKEREKDNKLYKPNKIVEEPDSEFVVRHIIMPINKARKIVSTSENDERREAIYTLESWQRKGHWRTYKDGHTIWIPETTCNRHMPVDKDKTVYLKL